MSSPTLQTLQDPILPLPWVCFRGGGFANPSPRPSMRALLDRGHPARVCAVPPSQAPPCSLLLSAVYPVWHCAHAPSQAPPCCSQLFTLCGTVHTHPAKHRPTATLTGVGGGAEAAAEYSSLVAMQGTYRRGWADHTADRAFAAAVMGYLQVCGFAATAGKPVT
jgi:hypothetical protein